MTAARAIGLVDAMRFLAHRSRLAHLTTGFDRQRITMAKYFIAALLGLASLAGCRMCACPYDDCYPVIENNHAPSDAIPEGAMPAPTDDDYSATGVPADRASHQPHLATGPRMAPANQ